VGRFTYRCALRWSDMDAYGHVNNARFLTLYEEARVALMFTAAREAGLTSFEDGIVIARHEVDYLRPVDYGDGVRIDLWISEIRASRFVVDYELFASGTPSTGLVSNLAAGDGADGALASRARSICVPFDLGAGRPRRVSAEERKFLSPWLG
jgi:acyl-CoA thioester hydrolase